MLYVILTYFQQKTRLSENICCQIKQMYYGLLFPEYYLLTAPKWWRLQQVGNESRPQITDGSKLWSTPPLRHRFCTTSLIYFRLSECLLYCYRLLIRERVRIS